MPVPLTSGKCLPPWRVFATAITLNVNTAVHMGSTTTVQVVDAVGEHALVQLPSSTLSDILGELNRINGIDELIHCLCTSSTHSRALECFDGF